VSPKLIYVLYQLLGIENTDDDAVVMTLLLSGGNRAGVNEMCEKYDICGN